MSPRIRDAKNSTAIVRDMVVQCLFTPPRHIEQFDRSKLTAGTFTLWADIDDQRFVIGFVKA